MQNFVLLPLWYCNKFGNILDNQYQGLFKSGQAAKITPYYSHFA